MRKIIVISLFFCLLAGCTASKTTRTDQSERPVNNFYDESFDPLSLNDDDIVINKEEEINLNESNKSDTNLNKETLINRKEVDGYRVQILATKNIETATLIQQKAKDQFAVMNYNTYLIFETPLYRVRVGDALNRKQAETIRDVAKDYGYDEAFIVRSKVLVDDSSKDDNL